METTPHTCNCQLEDNRWHWNNFPQMIQQIPGFVTDAERKVTSENIATQTFIANFVSHTHIIPQYAGHMQTS